MGSFENDDNGAIVNCYYHYHYHYHCSDTLSPLHTPVATTRLSRALAHLLLNNAEVVNVYFEDETVSLSVG